MKTFVFILLSIEFSRLLPPPRVRIVVEQITRISSHLACRLTPNQAPWTNLTASAKRRKHWKMPSATPAKSPATPVSSKPPIRWNQSVAFKCARVAHCAAIWPRSMRCTGAAIPGIWCRHRKMVNWSFGIRIRQTRSMRFRCVPPGWWRALMRHPEVMWPAVDWIIFARSIAWRRARVMCECPGSCPAILGICRAVGFWTIIRWGGIHFGSVRWAWWTLLISVFFFCRCCC